MKLKIKESFESGLDDIVRIVGKELNNDLFNDDDLINMIISKQRDYETVRRILKKYDRHDLLNTVADLRNSQSSKLIADLTKLAKSFNCDLKSFLTGAQSMFNLNPEYEYALSSYFTKIIPNEKNFYKYSVGFWDVSETPDREPDYVSYSGYSGGVSSEYWYTKYGVYRHSDHWGQGIASCDWFLSDHVRSRMVTRYETAFIKWKDLKAKGHVDFSNGVIMSIQGFDFSAGW